MRVKSGRWIGSAVCDFGKLSRAASLAKAVRFAGLCPIMRFPSLYWAESFFVRGGPAVGRERCGMEKLKVGVLFSGSGTNLQAIVDACGDGLQIGRASCRERVF